MARYSNLTEIQILKKMIEYRALARNPDSEFNVVSCVQYKTPDGKKHFEFGINTEFLLGHNSNLCAEGSALAHARMEGGHDIKIEKVWVMGGNKDVQADLAKPIFTPCCHQCLSKLNQFSNSETEIIQLPLITREAQIPEALSIAKKLNLKKHIPNLIDYNTEQAYAFMRAHENPSGIFEGKLIDVENRIRNQMLLLFGRDIGLDISLTGNITPLVKSMKDGPNTQNLGTLLGIMRNIHYTRNVTQKFGGIEAAIASVRIGTDSHYYASIGAYRGTKRNYPAYLEAPTQADREYWGASTTQLHIMGDPQLPNHTRLYPSLEDIYVLLKRTDRVIDDTGKKVPALRITALAPTEPGTQYFKDPRTDAEKLRKDTKDIRVATVLELSQLSPQLAFVSPKSPGAQR